MTTQTSEQTRSAKSRLAAAVGHACHKLQNAYLGNPNDAATHTARARLADLRRNGSLSLEHDPLALERVLFALLPEFDEELLGKGDAPSPSEEAAFVALTLFAIHMQSAKEPMHRPGTSFAFACGQLNARGLSGSIKSRVDAMLLAGHEGARLKHVRSLVTLLRSQNLGFDYGRLAHDLRALRDPKKRPGIQLRWSRDFSLGTFNSKSTES